MLETLLILACIGGNSNSCLTSGDAYQHYSGLKEAIEKYGKEHPILAQTLGAIALVKEKRTTFQIHGPYFFESSLQDNAFKSVAWYKKEF